MDTKACLAPLKNQSFYRAQICHAEELAARPASYGKLDEPLHPVLHECLKRYHLDRLFSHQAEAVNLVRRGQNVMVATPSASGKSLCYNIAVMEAILADAASTAIYLFPTKALAQDQMRKLGQLFEPDILGYDRYATYDGDNAQAERALIRRKAQIILSQP